MLLPCPHCRRQHRLYEEHVPSERARIQCPACGGVFVIHFAPRTCSTQGGEELLDSLLGADDKQAIHDAQAPTDACPNPPPQSSVGDGDDGQVLDVGGANVESPLFLKEAEESDGKGEPTDSAASGRGVSRSAFRDGGALAGMEARSARLAIDRGRPRFLLFWTLVPACCLLLALTGLLVSGARLNTGPSERTSSRTETGVEAPLSSSVSSHPQATQQSEKSNQVEGSESTSPGGQTENPVAQAFWATTSEAESPCEVLLRSKSRFRETGGEDTCQVYSLWISYLVLETAPIPVCKLDQVFALATDALQSETLCGPGYAFLAAYYLQKGLLDRSQSFLEQALHQAPDNPWVKLAEAVFYEEAYYDDQKVISILEGTAMSRPSFPLIQYLLGKAYIRQEKYREANAAFECLREDAKGQVAFWRIRRALTSLEQAADQGVEQAEALLAMSRAFTSLRDYPMAQDLYYWVLEQMPGSLPKRERMAAYCELGRIYVERGDNSSAYEAYRNALEMDPNYATAQEGIRDLLPGPSSQS